MPELTTGAGDYRTIFGHDPVFTRDGVFWPLRAAARNASAAATARAPAPSDLAEDRLQRLNARRERIPIGVYGVGQ